MYRMVRINSTIIRIVRLIIKKLYIFTIGIIIIISWACINLNLVSAYIIYSFLYIQDI